MKLIVSERHYKRILEDPDILNEQSVATDNNGELIVLQNQINEKLDAKQKEILDKTSIKISGGVGNIKLEIGGHPYDMKEMVRGVYAIVIPANKRLSFGDVPISELTPEIEKTKEFQSLAEKYPEIKQQLAQGTVKGVIYTTPEEQGTFKFTVVRNLDAKEDRKLAVPYGTGYPLGEFLERNKLIYVFKNGLFGILESGALNIDLTGFQFIINQQQKTFVPQTPVQIQTIQLQDLFNYNGIEFKNEAQTNQQVYAFVQQVKELIQKYGQAFIDHMRQQNPTVLGYSSVDGDPNQQIVGEYKPCSGGKTRRDYDLCLSQARAKVLADMLNKSLPELGGIFKFKGMGETTQFGPGWTQNSPTIPEQTAPNRRYILSPIKPFVVKQ